jgi:hypothetical protein
MTDLELVVELEAQRELMIAVATGGPDIDSANRDYRSRRAKISRALRIRRIKDPNPHSDLWQWYEYWSGNLGNWASRRAYVSQLYDPLIDQLTASPAGAIVFEELTGWDRVDRGIVKARRDLEIAETEEEFQAVGHLCREILISLGQATFDPARHPTQDGVAPSQSDAKRRLEGFFVCELRGSTAESSRAIARAAVNLANDVTHRRSATFRDAALCLEATVAVVNFAAVISGRRDGNPIERATQGGALPF